MKAVGIITQPLRTNYGGLLQNFALQSILKNSGYEPITIDQPEVSISPLRKFLSIIKTLVMKSVGKGANRNFPINKKQYNYIAKNTQVFIDKYISHTEIMLSSRLTREYVISNNIEALVVGSDQVWRPIYNIDIKRSFLDFTNGLNIKKVAYAASFGVDHWEYNRDQTIECSNLLKLFDGVSVREKTGVNLCKTYLGVDAKHVLDPTLLLDKEDYIRLAYNENEPPSDGTLFTYILDNNDRKSEIIASIEKYLNLKAFSVQPQSILYSTELEKCVYPLVTKWLKGYEDCKFVVCDSFHGAVFSIIFNKPFIVIANKERGLARFTSLLSLFDLTHRMISDTAESIDVSLLNQNINWGQVNNKRKLLKKESIDFLKESLK